MKTILFYLVTITVILMSNNVFAQDEFYNNNKTSETASVKTDSVDISSYSTAEDYYSVKEDEKNYDNKTEHTEVIEGASEEKIRKSERSEFISNIVVDVFINAVFIALTFWQ